MNIERDCEDCYKAEYMQQHVGNVFEGLISSVTEFGFYVELENTLKVLFILTVCRRVIIITTVFYSQ